MFIIWGTRGYEKDLGQTTVSGFCPNRNNEVTMIAKKAGKKFTLFWIPLFPVESSHYILCPICHSGRKIAKDELQQCLPEKNG